MNEPTQRPRPDALPRIAGEKEYQWTDPETALGQKVDEASIPSDVHYFIKRQKINTAGREYVCDLYRLVDTGGSKMRKSHVFKFRNEVPDEETIGLRFGPGEYCWFAKWLLPSGVETGCASEPILIGKEYLGRWEEEQRKSAPASPVPAAPAPASSAESEMDRALNMMDRFSTIMARMQGTRPDSPLEVLTKAHEAAGKMMQRSLEREMESNAKVSRLIAPPDPMDDDEGEDEEEMQAQGSQVPTGFPPWVETFLPLIQEWLPKLMGKGPVSAAYRTVLRADERFQEIHQDPAKWPVAVDALSKLLGEKKAQEALRIITGEPESPIPPEAPAASVTAKTKGKKK